jgi:uncharacterized surface anchored protein
VNKFIHLIFPLQIDDGWPPVGKESLVFTKADAGYQLKTAPLFVKDLSVDDVLAVIATNEMEVESWQHVFRSGRSTAWIMDFGDPALPDVLQQLRGLDCNIEHLIQFDYYAVDVPAEAPSGVVEACLDLLAEETAPVAYPSWRRDS